MNKKQLQAEATREKILKAAVVLFARRGYHRTTIADISQAIGLTSGAFFHHFHTKEALLEAVLEWLARGIQRYAAIAGSAEKGSFEVVERIIGMMCDHFRSNPEATICMAALATELAGTDHPARERIKDIYEVFIQAFSRILESHPRVKDPRAAAISFMGSVQGIAIQGLLREQEVSIDQLAGAFMSMHAAW